jgi:hypothetical protein
MHGRYRGIERPRESNVISAGYAQLGRKRGNAPLPRNVASPSNTELLRASLCG